METVREIVLVAAAVSMGLMAGVFGLYSHTVMPGLRRTDDRTFVGAFQALDRAIINPWFMLTGFLGAPALTGASAALLAGPGGPALSWTLVAVLLYLIVFLITVAVNVPKNNALKAAGEPDTITDLAGVRAGFDEAAWARWNLVRTLATTLAAICLAVALLRYGQG
ncbi:membrane protein [Catellatospora sp. IY07-71]|uniref:anthrone oxygenase family protein n=1 Tax=Catellatospora sp. IY07-71 TaxID=2728827 RepID=UPI001BB3C617|nr:anthrone oxygenase family protein [Catellatospora sp. IY07-71]BCJ76788.1 membrane protein [Catellatospora sp. IY07-71]